MSVLLDERITDELEALEAILMDDVIIKKDGEIPNAIETVVHPSTAHNISQQFVCVTLEVKLTPGYPDNRPDVNLRNPRGLDDEILTDINSQIKQKLDDCLGQPVMFELIELIRESLTASNLPSGKCAICLFGFVEGDVFIKTQCYHYFHSHCLARHLIAGKKYHTEEFEKLPNWQKMQAKPFQQTCPVCRCVVSCDVDQLKGAPLPIESLTASPFRYTPELKAMQKKMAALLAKQVAQGGVVGMGDTGPPPITITSPSDNDNEANGSTSTSQQSPRPENGEACQNGNSSNENAAPTSPRSKNGYRGPYRGFNRRGKPGRRGRGTR